MKKLEAIIPPSRVDAVRSAPADARVLVVPVADAVCIRTGEHSAVAIDGAADVSSHQPAPRHLAARHLAAQPVTSLG